MTTTILTGPTVKLPVNERKDRHKTTWTISPSVNPGGATVYLDLKGDCGHAHLSLDIAMATRLAYDLVDAAEWAKGKLG